MDNISVTVIGGYLGAGKTTLVNHILRTADARVAVLVNDFGDINIDEALIESEDGDTISLANGCICCSLIDGFSAALETIRALDPQPDRLVIEASGVADPATVAAYGHGPGLSLDAVVVVVDAETIVARSKDRYVGDTVMAQLRSGDILVLNKLDLVDGDAEVRTRQWLAEVAPEAVIVAATNSVVAPELLFGAEAGAGQPSTSEPGHHHDHGAESRFESWSWSSSKPLPRATVEALMAQLPDEVVRAKGVLTLIEDPQRRAVLQRVGKRWSLRLRNATGPQDAGQETGGQLVVIGLHGAIDDRWLAEQLDRPSGH